MTDSEDFGQIIFETFKDTVVLEKADWALDRVARVNARLQAVRPQGSELQVVIPWLETFTAFTAPGSYIFIARSLFQMLRTDEMAAFVIAHEMAHHDLGHLRILPDWLRNTAVKDKGLLLFALFRRIEHRLHGPENESAADVYALELCMDAGYSGRKCLKVFDIFQKYALDMRDLDAVFEPDIPIELKQLGGTWAPNLWTWMRQRQRGYLPIIERRKALENHFRQVTGGRHRNK